VKLLVDGRLLRSIRPTRSFKVLSYPSAMSVSTRALTTVTDLLRRHRAQRATRWRKLTVGRQALLVVAYLRKGETYTDLAGGRGCRSTHEGEHLHLQFRGGWLERPAVGRSLWSARVIGPPGGNSTDALPVLRPCDRRTGRTIGDGLGRRSLDDDRAEQ
jgi:hypothetical protein